MKRASYRGYGGNRPPVFPFLMTAALAVAAALVRVFMGAGVRFLALPLLGAAAVCLIYGISLRCRPQVGKWVRRVLFGLAGAALAFFIVLEGVVIFGGRTEVRAEPDVVIVLGCQVNEWGPSQLLVDRLDTALVYLEANPGTPVVVAGGQGRDEPTTEAEAMRDYLVARGADEALVWLEDASHNTSENLLNTRELLVGKGYDMERTHLLVVSNGFHLARVRLLAGRYGLSISTLAAPSTDLPAGTAAYIREVPALVKSFLFD